jgi:ABC-type sugar transport system substrate-binding protein
LDSVREVLRRRDSEYGREDAASTEKRFLTETIWAEMGEEEWQRCKERFSFHSDKGLVFLADFSEDPLKWSRTIAEGLSFRHRCLYSHRENRAVFLVPEDADREELSDSLARVVEKAIPEGSVQGWAVGSVRRGPELYLSCEEALEKLRERERNADARLRERLRIVQIRRKIGVLEAREVRALFDSLWKDTFSMCRFPVAQARMVSIFALLLDDYADCGGADGEFPFDPAEEIMGLKDLPEWEAWEPGPSASCSASSRPCAPAGSVPLVKAMDYIGERYADRLQLASAAEAAQVSGAYLSRLFSEHLNTTFIDYLTELRIRHAERLIAETRMSMKEIASPSDTRTRIISEKYSGKRPGFRRPPTPPNTAPAGPRLPGGRAMKRFFLFLSIVAVLAACSAGGKGKPPASSSARSAASADASGKPAAVTIGFSIATDTFIIERWNKDIKIFTGAARELGADVIVQLSAGGTKEQIAQINFLLDRHIDVLVVIAHDTDMIAGVVKQVRDSGVPVIAYDRMIQGVPIDAYVSFDNREVGRLFGARLSEAVPQGRYLIVNGSVKDNNSYEVHSGVMEILDPKIKSGAVALVDDIWLEEWSFDEALEKIGKVLERTTASTPYPAGTTRSPMRRSSSCPSAAWPARWPWWGRTPT